MASPMPWQERFWAKVDRSGGPEACWNWQGALNHKNARGYGRFAVHRHMQNAHRIAYELEIGPIPSGYVVDHLCGTRVCVNPAHLEAVTLRENSRRMVESQRRASKLSPKSDRVEQVAAHHAVARAIGRGRLVRQPCAVCGATKVHAHHPRGYVGDARLDVEWLCALHHHQAHDTSEAKNGG